MTRYVDNDGTVMIWTCGDCGAELEMIVVSRWPDGQIQEAQWVCSADETHPRGKGFYLDGGTLDLGLVRDSDLGKMTVEIFDA